MILEIEKNVLYYLPDNCNASTKEKTDQEKDFFIKNRNNHSMKSQNHSFFLGGEGGGTE